MIVVVMGVCGSGKSTVGGALAKHFSWQFAEGDDYHPASNKYKMSQGTPLTDQDRLPWLLALHELITKWHHDQTNAVLTCSALKRSYRQVLICGNETSSNAGIIHDDIPSIDMIDQPEASRAPETRHINVRFVYLHGTLDVLMSRMGARTGHFMPSSLLQSQLDILEEPGLHENYITVDINSDPLDIVNYIVKYLEKSHYS